MAECKGCGKKVVWARTSDGTAIPLDPTPPTYRLLRDGSGAITGCERAEDVHVTHFATCKVASQFSGGNKSTAPASGGQGADQVSPERAKELMDFLRALDCNVEIELNEWEREFVGSIMERDVKYNGNVRFNKKMEKCVEKMMEKYGPQVREPGNTRVSPPARPTTQEPVKPKREERRPLPTSGEDNIPF